MGRIARNFALAAFVVGGLSSCKSATRNAGVKDIVTSETNYAGTARIGGAFWWTYLPKEDVPDLRCWYVTQVSLLDALEPSVKNQLLAIEAKTLLLVSKIEDSKISLFEPYTDNLEKGGVSVDDWTAYVRSLVGKTPEELGRMHSALAAQYDALLKAATVNTDAIAPAVAAAFKATKPWQDAELGSRPYSTKALSAILNEDMFSSFRAAVSDSVQDLVVNGANAVMLAQLNNAVGKEAGNDTEVVGIPTMSYVEAYKVLIKLAAVVKPNDKKIRDFNLSLKSLGTANSFTSTMAFMTFGLAFSELALSETKTKTDLVCPQPDDSAPDDFAAKRQKVMDNATQYFFTSDSNPAL